MMATAPNFKADATMLDAALLYAELGWPVFPCTQANKRPITKHGFKDATNDAEIVRRWWTSKPNAMIGVATGERTGFFVLDLDIDAAKGLDGVAALTAFGELPDAPTVRTPRGGKHVYFNWRAGIDNARGELPAGVDVRGEGGYIIAPPSRRADGSTYRWEASAKGFKPAETPHWLICLMQPRKRPYVNSFSNGTNGQNGARSNAYASAAVERECGAIATAQDGVRNETLNRAAFSLGQLVAGGLVDEGEVSARLLAAALASGLPRQEAEKTIASGLTAGLQEPRTMPESDARKAASNGSGVTEAGGNYLGAGGSPILDPRNPLPSARALVAARFMDHDLRTMHRHRDTFWQFTGSYYRQADDEEVRRAAWLFLETAMQIDAKGNAQPFKPTQARVSDVIDAVKAVSALDPTISPPAWLDGDNGNPPATEFLAVANGLLHLPTCKIHQPTPAFFGLSASEVELDPAAPVPRRWQAFLSEVFGADQEAIEALQDWIGYVLATNTSQQKVLLMVGPKRSGKGTIARVLKALLGRDSVAGPTLASLASNFGLEPLIGKPLAIISDARIGGRSDHAAIAERLLSISGEDALTIDRKFRPAWHGTLPTRFMILTNQLPYLADSSGALTSRFIILQLKNTFFGREDPGLSKVLMEELPGILNWALVGYDRLRARGQFIQPESAREALEDLEALSSPVKTFVEECCCLGPGLQASINAVFSAWTDWCAASGRRETGTKQGFGRDLRSAYPGITTRQPGGGGNRARVYQGIAVR